MMTTQRPTADPHPGTVPWSLYPKLICVAVLLGGFVCTLVLILATPRESIEDWQSLVDAIGILFKLVIVPTSFATVVFSVLLFWRGRRWFLRRRWAQVKLALLIVTLPATHLLARNMFTSLRRDIETSSGYMEPATMRLHSFTILVGLTIAVLLIALWLARFKPRLGQRRTPE